jgi:hypothetical protein
MCVSGGATGYDFDVSGGYLYHTEFNQNFIYKRPITGGPSQISSEVTKPGILHANPPTYTLPRQPRRRSWSGRLWRRHLHYGRPYGGDQHHADPYKQQPHFRGGHEQPHVHPKPTQRRHRTAAVLANALNASTADIESTRRTCSTWLGPIS